MDKYDSMSDGELRCAVAERLGWAIIPVRDDTLALLNPEGEEEYWWDRTPEITFAEDIAAAWDCLADFNGFPNWPTDANDALALPAPDGASLWHCAKNKYESKHWEASFPCGNTDIYAEHSNPARAWTIAWLRWQDAQEDGE